MDQRENQPTATFANIPLRVRLLIMVGPLTLALLGFVGIQVQQAWQASETAANAQTTATVAVAIGDAVHELQQERGLSATYLADPDRALRSQLTRKHAAADDALTALDERLRSDTALQATGVSFTAVKRGLEQINRLRPAVLSQSMSADEAVQRYSRVIAELMTAVERLADTMPPGTLNDTVRTLMHLGAAQEAAGKERATLSRATATGTLTLALRDAAVSLAAEQTTSLRLARNTAPDAIADRLTDRRADTVQTLRERILGGNVDAVSQQQWWDASTKRIEALFSAQGAVNDYLLRVADRERISARNILLLDAGLAVMIVAALALCWLLGEDMRRRLSTLFDTVETVERTSDLTLRSGMNSRDEVGGLAERLDRMLAQFSSTVGNVAQATDELASPAEQLSTVSQQLHDGIRRQQSETDQVASAMNEMTAAIQEVARNASDASNAATDGDRRTRDVDRQVSAVSQDVSDVAAAVEQVATLMRSLEERAEQMSQVVDIIQSVTEQTNLLALNASIEAARAGEHGRGFAVVATEVRSLAQKTSESTDSIRELITGLQKAAVEGVAAVQRGHEKVSTTHDAAETAREALEEITASVSTMADMTSQIATATEQQSATAEEINRNIASICQIGEETANGARDTSGASDELARLAARLQAQVQQFRV